MSDSNAVMRATSSPLLHGRVTKSPLDLVTERLFFVVPLTMDQIQWLNTVIYHDRLFWINYWSLTHTFVALFWGVLHLLWPDTFSIRRYLMAHTLFELWELWAGGYLTGETPLILPEIVDIIMDTVFGLLGIYLVKWVYSLFSS